MKEQKKIIQDNLPDILNEIRTKILNEYGLIGWTVSEISFSPGDGCPEGYVQVCKSYGKDPRTGLPIIKCKCVQQ